MAVTNTLATGQRAERKTLITVAEWSVDGSETPKREILGVRTEDSSINFNADISKVTDILGITYADVNKTEPQQDFDPLYIIGGSDLSAYMIENALRNNISAYNGKFTVYIISAFLTAGSASTDDGKYFTVKHVDCSIIPTSLGGDAYNSMPIEVHLSNHITTGTVDKLTSDFVFTAET